MRRRLRTLRCTEIPLRNRTTGESGPTGPRWWVVRVFLGTESVPETRVRRTDERSRFRSHTSLSHPLYLPLSPSFLLRLPSPSSSFPSSLPFLKPSPRLPFPPVRLFCLRCTTTGQRDGSVPFSCPGAVHRDSGFDLYSCASGPEPHL